VSCPPTANLASPAGNAREMFKLSKAVFLKRFYSIAPLTPSIRRFRPPSLIKQIQGSKFKELYLKEALTT